ncbi:hypothetical protein [Algibacter sp. L1A34]|uniref:hypothetical protein n=1 Tax=Algibacter sp. L1A34 TaxID=2686365 RepID=UPI00131D72AD|nr:hypothetical protein [Algibacter sp. L1A34]
MTNTFRITITTLLLIAFNCLVTSCDYQEEETIDKTSIILPNGKHIVVEKTNTESTAIGVFSNHNYGTTHRFTYKFSIDQDRIDWDGGSGEPKNITFCKDTTYIRYLKEKTITTNYTDSLTQETERHQRNEIQEFFQKHIDKRYFFKLLGSDYWVDIPLEHYTSISNECEEYQIPNDEELALPSMKNDDFKE